MSAEPVDVIEESDRLILHELTFVLEPDRWRRYCPRESLTWRTLKLHHRNRQKLEQLPGIYSLVLQPHVARHPKLSYLYYVGQTVDLKRRFTDYLGREERDRPRIFRFLRRWSGFIHFCYALLDESSLAEVEEKLIEAFVPPGNSRFPGTLEAARRAF